MVVVQAVDKASLSWQSGSGPGEREGQGCGGHGPWGQFTYTGLCGEGRSLEDEEGMAGRRTAG